MFTRKFANCYGKVAYKRCHDKNGAEREAKQCLQNSTTSLKDWVRDLRQKISHESDMHCSNISSKGINYIGNKCLDLAEDSEEYAYCLGDATVKICGKINSGHQECVDVCARHGHTGLVNWVKQHGR